MHVVFDAPDSLMHYRTYLTVSQIKREAPNDKGAHVCAVFTRIEFSKSEILR